MEQNSPLEPQHSSTTFDNTSERTSDQVLRRVESLGFCNTTSALGWESFRPNQVTVWCLPDVIAISLCQSARFCSGLLSGHVSSIGQDGRRIAGEPFAGPPCEMAITLAA